MDFKALGQGRLGNHGRGSEPTHPLHHSSGQGSAPSASSKGPTPSSSRPAPSHSILKKTRGPSSSGPRPTARFASPPASYEEAIAVGEEVTIHTTVAASEMPPPPLSVSARQQRATSSSTPTKSYSAPTAKSTALASNPAVPETEMRPPPLPSPARGEKTTTNAGRRIVAATAASRRRPVMVRRPSSQSSAGSDTGTRVAGFVAASRRSGSKKTNPTAAQLLGQGSSSSQGSDAGISAKAAGKRPAKTPTGKRSSSQSIPAPADNHVDGPETTQQVRPASPQRRTTWDVKDTVASQVASQTRQAVIQQSLPTEVPPPVAGFVADQTVRHRAPPMLRSRSNNSEHGVALLPSQATSSVAMFITTARGQFDSETVTTEPVVPEARDIPDQVRFGSQTSSSVLDLQFRPTPPNPTPPIPFGRSRSELALLLRRGNSSRGEAD